MSPEIETENARQRRSQIKIAIVVGIIVSIVFYIFIQPIIDFIFSRSTKIGAYFYSGLVDSFYFNAALGSRNWVSVLIFQSMCFPALVLFAAFPIAIWLRQRQGTKSQLRGRYVGIVESRGFTLFFGLICFSGVCSTLLLMTVTIADLQLNASFQQRLAVISPAISDIEHKRLLADWASMQSRADYERINQALDALAIAHKVTLPKPLIP